MTEQQQRYDRLGRAVDALIFRGELAPTGDADLDVLARLASGLRGLPDPDFKARLRAELFPQPARWGLLSVIGRHIATRTQRMAQRPRVTVPLAFATAAVAAAVIAVLVLSPFGEQGAEQEAFGALPAPTGKGGGGVVIPGTSGMITYTLLPDQSLPTSALAYRLRPPEVTTESMAEIARRLGIEGPVEFIPAEEGDDKGGATPARYRVASGQRWFEMLVDGHFSYQDEALSEDMKHAPPDAQAPSEEAAGAAAEAWLRLTGVTGDGQYRIQVSEPTNGSRDVIVTLPRPENQILDHPRIFLLVTSDGEIAQVSGYWPTIEAESGYPLHTVEELLTNLRNLRGEFNFLEPVGGEDDVPVLADRLQDAEATVESVEVAHTLGIADDGQAYLLPVYIVRGHLTQEGLPEPESFAIWVPATGPTAGPPQVPTPLADLLACATSSRRC